MIQEIINDLSRLKPLYNINRRYKYIKLIFVLEAWAVIYFRIEDFIGHRSNVAYFPFKILLLILKPIIQGMTGTRICFGSKIGEGLLLHYSPGIIIAAGTIIGRNATIMTGGCLVYKANDKGDRAPVVGDNVVIGTGSIIIGPVTIGNDVVVGAGSVVINDIPSGVTVVGVPAKIITQK